MSSQQEEQKYNVLFVDDSQAELKFIKMLFEITNIPANPMFISSAPLALKALSEFRMVDFPDCIIVDINMPLLNGFEFIERFEKEVRPHTANTKLFMYSTSIHSKDLERVSSLSGVEDFISKPFDEQKFTDIILPKLQLSPPNKTRYAATAPS